MALHLALVRRALLGVLLLTALTTAAFAQVAPTPSSMPAASASALSASETDAPAVAHRLWHDLLCTCPEKDCEHESLEACECDFAVKERERILADVRRHGFGTPERDDATYKAVFRDYIKAHGGAADGTQEHGKGLPWLELLAGVAAVAVMVSVPIWLSERIRARLVNNTRKGATTARWKKKRRRQ